MKAWSWFTVTPMLLVAAYSATPMLVDSLTGHNAAAVTITQIDLPVEIVKPATTAADAAGREINYAAFATDESKAIAKTKPVTAEFALQSILITDGVGVAVVNGNMVRQGDKVGNGYRVVRIEPQAVWLAVKPASNTKIGAGNQQVSKDRLKILHFPEYRDDDLTATKPASIPGAQLSATPEPKVERAELEKNYKQILEMLKL